MKKKYFYHTENEYFMTKIQQFHSQLSMKKIGSSIILNPSLSA
jgi:hypothetical protein